MFAYRQQQQSVIVFAKSTELQCQLMQQVDNHDGIVFRRSLVITARYSTYSRGSI